jgi:hypothetical protein
MTAIRIRRTIDAETLHVPELRPYLGQAVEIIILAGEVMPAPANLPSSGDWAVAARACQALDGYDFEDWRDQRAADSIFLA